MSDALPPGFDGVYRCEKHPEREVVAPISCRRCLECHDAAILAYASQIERTPPWRAENDVTSWGETLDESRVRKRREGIL